MLFTPKPLNPRISSDDRQNSPDISFVVWASIILTALALVSVALGVAPIADP